MVKARKPRKAGPPKSGKGLLDILKKGVAIAKQVSDVTGIKPSALLAGAKSPYGALGASLLASQGLGKKKRGPRRKAGGCRQAGSGFFEDFLTGFKMPFEAIGKLGSTAVSGLLGDGKKRKRGRGYGVQMRGRGNGSFNGNCAYSESPNSSGAMSGHVGFGGSVAGGPYSNNPNSASIGKVSF